VVFGNPKHEMAASATSISADLVVMTTHGRSGLAQLIMGSNAASLIQHTTVPVLLIRPVPVAVSPSLTDGAPVPPDFDLEKAQGPLLVTLDGTPEAEVVLEPALKLAQAINVPIHLLRVVPPLVPFSYGDISARFSQDIRDEIDKHSQEAYQYLDQIQAQISAQGLECNGSVRIGEVAEEILDFIRKIHPSLLAMATRGRGRLGQVLLGSVAGEVAHHCQLPVLLIHIPVHETHHSPASSIKMA
jgi:nucleotide-binding universal stress UspA family protein